MPRQSLTDDEHPGSFDRLADDAHGVERRCADCGLVLHPGRVHLSHPPLEEPVVDDRTAHLVEGYPDHGG